MKPFRERNPVIIGAISLAVIVLLILAAFRAQDLPLIGGGDTYTAAFSESGGLKPDDPVRIAGVRVGKVEKIELDGDHVKVTFRVKTDSEFGTETGAAIRVNTLLGAMYLALEPAGSGQLEAGRGDPGRAHQLAVRRRRGVLRAGRDRRRDRHRPAGPVADHAGRPDPQHARGVPGRAVRRLPALGEHRGRRTSGSACCCSNLQRVSTVLNERDEDIVDLMKQSDTLFQALVARRDAVHNLLVSTSTLSSELSALVRQSRDDLKPALTQLDDVVGILNKNEENIDNGLRLMAPFYRVFANTLGNGPWFDTYIQNMPPAPDLANGGGVG